MKEPLMNVSYKKALRYIKKSKRAGFIKSANEAVERMSKAHGLEMNIYNMTFNIGKDLLK